METFFMLMVAVFLPFGWYLNRALRYTNETVGEDSPLYKEWTYQFSAYQYFSDFTKILYGALLVELLGGAVLVVIKVPVGYELELLLAVSCLLAFACHLLFFFYFDWQYWLITRDVFVTFNPFQQSITINGPEQYIVLTPDNVIQIEQHLIKIDNSKNPFSGYGYYLFYTADGQIGLINTIFFSHIGHFEFLERFFPHTPPTLVWERVPHISDLNHPENLKPPNFAALNQR